MTERPNKRLGYSKASEVTVTNIEGEILRVEPALPGGKKPATAQVNGYGRSKRAKHRQKNAGPNP